MKGKDTTEKRRPSLKSVATAAVVASLLMLVFGSTHRMLRARLSVPVAAIPIDSDALDGLPMWVGQWIGQDIPLDEAIVDVTNTDAHVSRQYAFAGGTDSVLLYIGAGVHVYEVMDHRPDICYIRNGWTMTERHSVNLRLQDGTVLPCLVYEFSRGILERTKVVVLYYFIADGRYGRDVSEWRYNYRNIQHVGQIQIVTPMREALTGDTAVASVSRFATDSAPTIMALFTRVGIGRVSP